MIPDSPLISASALNFWTIGRSRSQALGSINSAFPFLPQQNLQATASSLKPGSESVEFNWGRECSRTASPQDPQDPPTLKCDNYGERARSKHVSSCLDRRRDYGHLSLFLHLWCIYGRSSTALWWSLQFISSQHCLISLPTTDLSVCQFRSPLPQGHHKLRFL